MFGIQTRVKFRLYTSGLVGSKHNSLQNRCKVLYDFDCQLLKNGMGVFLENKRRATSTFVKLKTMVEKQIERKVKCLRNNVGKF